MPQSIWSWIFLLALCAVPSTAVAQCGLGGPNPFVPIEILASAIGQRGFGGTAFTMRATCPGEPNAHMKFKLDTVNGPPNPGLIISPSSGTTPVEIQVGVDPNAVANWFPVQGTRSLRFTTVDQDPALNATVSVRVTLTTPDPPVIQSVVNAASHESVVTPGAGVLIRGTSLGPNISATLDQTGMFPTTLGNTTVAFNGIPAPLLSSSPTAIKAVAPYGIAGQPAAQVVVTHYPGSTAEQVSAAFSVQVTDTSLGIFSRTRTGDNQNTILNCDANGCSPNSAENPAPPGSIIVLFATGVAPWAGPRLDGSIAILAQLYRDAAELTIGGQPAQILYAGVAPYQVWGVFQVNARVPAGSGSGLQPVVLTVGQASNAAHPVMLAVE